MNYGTYIRCRRGRSWRRRRGYLSRKGERQLACMGLLVFVGRPTAQRTHQHPPYFCRHPDHSV